MRELRIQPYREHSRGGGGSGELRYLQLTAVGTQPGSPAAQDDALASVQVVFVWNSDPVLGTPVRLQQLTDLIWQRHRHDLTAPGGRKDALMHSLWANLHCSGGNVILGDSWRQLASSDGSGFTWQMLGGSLTAFAPGSFMQANFGMMERALSAIQQHTPYGSQVLDLHAGVGCIGLSLAASRHCRLLRCVEINPEGQRPFLASLERLSSTDQTRQLVSDLPADESEPNRPKFEYIVDGAAAAMDRSCVSDIDVITVDPPRKGLEPELLTQLTSADGAIAKSKVKTLLYLSCGFTSFRQNITELIDSGMWRITCFESFSFFPGTNHLEAFAVLKRNDRIGMHHIPVEQPEE